MIKRELYLKRVRALMNKDIVKIITGIRRCGKTSLLKLIIDELKNNGVPDENIFFISFESIEFKHIKKEEQLDNFIYTNTHGITGKIYLFFDEIQHVENWESSINSFRVDLNCDIYITGSNSTLLSGKLGKLLTGRQMEIKMYPFSFKELLQYHIEENNEDITPLKEQELFNEYQYYGGFPFLQQLPSEEKIDYLESVYTSILFKDIIEQHEIRNVDLLTRLLEFMVSNIGKPFTINSIVKYMKHEKRKVSTDIITNYIQYFIDAFILYKVKRNDLIGKKYLNISEKYYVVDPGFRTLLVEQSHEYEGFLLENIIYNELLRRGYKISIGKYRNLEIDFVCKRHNETIYVQVSKSIFDDNTFEREFKPLKLIQDNYPKYILTLDTKNYSQEGIKHLNIIDFLKSDI